MLMTPLWSTGVRVAVAESLIRDLGRVSEWCDLWGMKLNASKTKTMIVSRSHTKHPQSPPLTIGRTVLKESDDLVILGVTFDWKMTFGKHLRSVSRAASQRLVILRKSWRVFQNRSLIGRCFWGFVLPVLVYYSAVWCSAADTHLKLLDRAVSIARFLTGVVFGCDNSHRRSVAVLCMLYMIRCNPVHPLNGTLPGPYVPVRVTRRLIGTLMHRLAAEPCRTAGLFFLSRCPSGTILRTAYSMVWDWRVSRAGPMLLYSPKLLYPYYSLLLFFPFSFCLYVHWENCLYFVYASRCVSFFMHPTALRFPKSES